MENELDMNMMAEDVAELLSDEYGIDVDANDVATALPAFVAAMQECARAHR